MTEREPGLDPPRLVEPVADEDAFSVEHVPGLARVVEERGGVLQPLREGERQAARRVDVAEQHVGQGIAALLARVPELHDRRHPVGPLHCDRRAGVDDDHRARIDRGDPLDQVRLAARQREVGTVATLGLPLVIEPDDDDGHVRRGGRGHGPLEHVGGPGRGDAHLGAVEAVGRETELETQLMRAVLDHRMGGGHRVGVGAVDHQPVVDEEPGPPVRAHLERVLPHPLRHVRGGDACRPRDSGQRRVGRLGPTERRAPVLGGVYRRS